MVYGREVTGKIKDEDIKLFKVLRSAMQDTMLTTKQETIDILFPEKIVDGEDIGEIASKWATRVITTCRFYKNKEEEMDEKQAYKLVVLIWALYNKGINLNTSKTWKMIWIKMGLPAISNWIERFPASGRIAAADNLEKPVKKKESEDWWK